MILQRTSHIFQHIQPYKKNRRQWRHIGCRHWASLENKYSCSQQRFPRTSARRFCVQTIGNNSRRGCLGTTATVLNFSSIGNPSKASCCSSFQNWAVYYPFCSGSHLPFPYSSAQQWWSFSQTISCVLHSYFDPLRGQWWSHNHLNSSHGRRRFHTKVIFRVSHLPLSIDYLYVATFWTY